MMSTNKLRFNKKKLIIPIVLLGILIILLLLGYYFCWPKYSEFSDKRRELETKDEEIIKRGDYLTELKDISELLKEKEAEISKIESALPLDPSVASLFNFFQKASSGSGLILANVNMSELFSSKGVEFIGANIRKMPFSVTVTGSYASFKDFLKAVYTNSRMIEVKTLRFAALMEGENETVSDLFDFSLEMETYAYQLSETEEMVEDELLE